MRITYGYETGHTATYGAYKPDGTVVTAAGTSLPEIAVGSSIYSVVDTALESEDIVPVFIDGVFRGFATFPDNIALYTTVASKTSDKVFRLAKGPSNSPADNNFYRHMAISITDKSGRVKATRVVTGYVASTLEVTVDNEYRFSLAVGDTVIIWADTYSATATSAAVQEIVDGVWDESKDDHNSPGTMGEKQNDIQAGVL